jgi:hypothetical protein
VVSDGDQSDDTDTGSVIYVKAKAKAKDSSNPSTGEAADSMAVDDPDEVRSDFYQRLLDRQLVLIERMVNHLQMNNATPVPPNTPKAAGKFVYPSLLSILLTRTQ